VIIHRCEYGLYGKDRFPDRINPFIPVKTIPSRGGTPEKIAEKCRIPVHMVEFSHRVILCRSRQGPAPLPLSNNSGRDKDESWIAEVDRK
jgi:hypothetical protein